MSQGKGKASSSPARRHSSDDHSVDNSPRLGSSSDSPISAPSSSFDASIPFNLPPRRSMKMLKDGSDFVWPEAAHSLFVRGLQAWKFLNIGSKRARAPRGEGKTDFLVRYLQSHGVERTKKQVASHLQVLRTEWRNSDNTVLLSLVDDRVPHTRSLSEPSLPTLSPSNDSSSNSLSSVKPVPNRGDDRPISTPSLSSPVSTQPSPPSSSSLYHPAHDVYNSPPRSYPESVPGDTLHLQPGVNVSSWQAGEDTIWNTIVAPESNDQGPAVQYPTSDYDAPAVFHDYDIMPGPVPSSAFEQSGFSSDYYAVPGSGDAPSSSAPTPLVRTLRPITGLPLEAGESVYDGYNTPSYAIPQAPQQPQVAYGAASIAYSTEPYQMHFDSHAEPQICTMINAGPTSSCGDVDRTFFADQVQQQPHPRQ